MVQDTYDNDVVNGHRVEQITGYPNGFVDSRNTYYPSSQIHYEGYSGGRFNYAVYDQNNEKAKLPGGQTFILVNSTGEIGNQFKGAILTNTDPSSIDIEFSSSTRMHSTIDGTFLYEGYSVDSYFTINSIELNYDNRLGGAYEDPIYDVEHDAYITTNVDGNGNPLKYITIVAQELASNSIIRFALLQARNAYEYNQTTLVSGEVVQNTNYAVKLNRYWYYQNKQIQNCYIEDDEFKTLIYNYSAQSLTDRTINNWIWPIQNYTVNLIAAKDAEMVDPSLYIFTYKNRGGSEETLQLASETDSGWSIYGLAYVDSDINKPTKIFDNQTFKINGVEYAGDNDTYIYSSDPLYIEGYKEQSLLMIDGQNNEYYPRLLISKFDFSNNDYSKNIQNKTITITDEQEDLNLTIQLPSLNSYIFSVKNYSNLGVFNFQIDNDYLPNDTFKIYCLNKNTGYYDAENDAYVADGLYHFEEKGIYYFYVRLNNETNNLPLTIDMTMTIEAQSQQNQYADSLQSDLDNINSQQNIKVEILPFKKLNYQDESPISYADLNLDDENSLISYIKSKTQYGDKDIFNYFYLPQNDKRIENPLSSSQFNNHNHFYNQYTICKINTYDSLNDSNIFINT